MFFLCGEELFVNLNSCFWSNRKRDFCVYWRTARAKADKKFSLLARMAEEVQYKDVMPCFGFFLKYRKNSTKAQKHENF